MNKGIAALVGGLLLGTAVNASAQTTWDENFFLNASVGVGIGAGDVSTTGTPSIYDEPATITATRSIGTAFLYDITAGLPISGNFGAAVSFSARSGSADGTMTGSIPDPVFFDQPRAVTGPISDMDYSERWLGFLAAWVTPVGEKLDLFVLAGPAIAMVEAGAPAGVAVTEAAGGPTVVVSLDSVSKTLFGIQAGVDLRYMLTETVGVGGFARYSGAWGDLQEGSSHTAGGFQLGAGVRLKF